MAIPTALNPISLLSNTSKLVTSTSVQISNNIEKSGARIAAVTNPSKIGNINPAADIARVKNSLSKSADNIVGGIQRAGSRLVDTATSLGLVSNPHSVRRVIRNGTTMDRIYQTLAYSTERSDPFMSNRWVAYISDSFEGSMWSNDPAIMLRSGIHGNFSSAYQDHPPEIITDYSITFPDGTTRTDSSPTRCYPKSSVSNINYYIDEISTPSFVVNQEHSYREGKNHTYAGNVSIDGISITLYGSADGYTRRYIDHWFSLLYNRETNTFNVKSAYSRAIIIELLDPSNVPASVIILRGCFPVNLHSISLSSSSELVSYKLDLSVDDMELVSNTYYANTWADIEVKDLVNKKNYNPMLQATADIISGGLGI